MLRSASSLRLPALFCSSMYTSDQRSRYTIATMASPPIVLLNVAALLSLAAVLAGARTLSAAEPVGGVNFDRDVRSILSDHCFKCHGPDAGQLKAGLRLDQRESAFGAGDSELLAFVPHKPEESEVIKRITATDADLVMPPPEENKPLSPTEVELLKRWIAEGANWTNHWAFEPIQSPPVPHENLAPGQVENPIDAFVLQRLKSEGLAQSPKEDRARLIRRVSLDLTGLPPSIKEVDEFLHDTAPNAFEKVVDRLLGNEHFGERMALPWLDLARYGDTSGYHNDSLRDMWLWREWVIQAFNANMPFDQFTIEQLAGDLVPDATIQQQVASGFHRNVMTSDEGGLIDAEYRNLYVVDRVATTGVTWLGMTIACAQCHDHKYDPVSQLDFYKLYAFFNNVPETGKDGVRDRNPKPFLRVPSEEQSAELKRREAEWMAADASFKALTATLPAKQAEWESTFVSNASATSLPAPLAHFPLDENGDGTWTEARAGENAESASSTTTTLKAVAHGEVAFVEGVVGKSFNAATSQWFEYGDHFNFEKDQAFSLATYLFVAPKGGAPLGKMDDANGSRGWDIEFHGLRPSVHLIHRWPADAIHIQADADLPANTFVHLAFTYDGSGKAAGLKLYVNGTQVKTTVKQDGLQGSITTTTPFSIGRRGASSVRFTGRIDDVKVYDRELAATDIAAVSAAEIQRLLAMAAEQRTAPQKEQIEKFFRQTQVPEFAELQQRTAELKKSRDDFENALPNTMVMAELDKPRDTFIKVRGNYDMDGDKVDAGFPGFLPQAGVIASSEKRLNRLDLAKWLTSPEHPLTARVTVNRWWSLLFGTGLVKTLNDFGSQGERPSHPELLDWLAADFMRDWDTKRVLKQMVLSATYQQTSRVSADLLARDQENRLLARGPRQRLDAELLRDNALAIAGILNPAIGGKSIKPAQPDGTWEINEMSGYKYEKSQGADLYRRGLYVYWRRSTVYPSFVTLDAPTREFCVSQRAKTSTPLQSLVLMNDPVFVEAARALAQRILAEAELDQSARLALAWRLALAREPSENELAVLSRTLEQQLANYRGDIESSKKLNAVGDLAKPEELDASELAAWTTLSNVLLNLNETLSN